MVPWARRGTRAPAPRGGQYVVSMIDPDRPPVSPRLPPPIADAQEVTAVAMAIRRAARFALDLEFMSEDRYVPDLALVQVAWDAGEGVEAVAIDPLAVDPRPVLELLGDADIETVLHAGQADLALVGHAFDIAGRTIIDTQIAAAFLGMGDQIGYAPFIARTLGVEIDKGGQFTEWLKRPLTDDQLAYALADVRYLLPAWLQVLGALEARGRTSWVVEESTRLADTWAERIPPEETYRRVSGWATLRPRQQGSLRALAAWREREALAFNRPPSRILNDRSMLELARRPPRTQEAMREVRGVSDGTVRRYGRAIIDALQAGAEDPPPAEPRRRQPPAAVQVWAGMLGGLVQAHCRDADIAARFVASRSDLDDLALWWFEGDRDIEPPLSVLRGWRRALVGEAALDWLKGSTAIVADAIAPLGIRLEPRDGGPAPRPESS